MTMTTTSAGDRVTGRAAGRLRIGEEPFGSSDSVRLRAAARIERAALGVQRTPIDPLVAPSNLVAHLVARTADGTAVGCGALVAVDDGVVEVHRYYIRSDARGSGAGSAMLAALEDAAVGFDAPAIVIETATELPDTAVFLLRHGYRQIAAWGPYVGDPTSLCFSKVLWT